MTLEAEIGRLLMARGWTLALAESCTGGLISHCVTMVPGSSAYFLGSVVAYANSAKQTLLGVDAAVLASQGAVSEAVAGQMAAGVRERLGADIGISVTGVAGPDGGTPGKPVGLVFIGFADARGEVNVRRYTFEGNRLEINEQAHQAALEWLKTEIKE